MLEMSSERKWNLLKDHANRIQQNTNNKTLLDSTSNNSSSGKIHNKPQYYVNTLKKEPSVEVLLNLKDSLSSQPSNWFIKFLELERPSVLLDILADTERKPRKSDNDTKMQDESIGCLRIVMNQKMGLESILKIKHSIRKLTLVLDSPKITTRIIVLELLAAICVISTEGHK